MTDALVAFFHFVAIIALSACLIAECLFYAPSMSRDTFARLARVDFWYGILAVVVIISGVAHAIFSPKGDAYYLHDWIFWTKMLLFVAVGLLSIAPTLHFIRLRKTADGATSIAVPSPAYRTMRLVINLEVAILFFIPLCAALMARGYGTF